MSDYAMDLFREEEPPLPRQDKEPEAEMRPGNAALAAEAEAQAERRAEEIAAGAAQGAAPEAEERGPLPEPGAKTAEARPPASRQSAEPVPEPEVLVEDKAAALRKHSLAAVLAALETVLRERVFDGFFADWKEAPRQAVLQAAEAVSQVVMQARAEDRQAMHRALGPALARHRDCPLAVLLAIRLGGAFLPSAPEPAPPPSED